jgi:hypothetical protein
MKKLLGAIALLTVTAPALAAHDFRDAGVSQRQHQLDRRIEQGWRAGELTRGEYRRLQRALREIDRVEHHFSADGRLSPRERHELHARLDDLAREIYRQKRDVERGHGFYNGDYRAERPF